MACNVSEAGYDAVGARGPRLHVLPVIGRPLFRGKADSQGSGGTFQHLLPKPGSRDQLHPTPWETVSNVGPRPPHLLSPKLLGQIWSLRTVLWPRPSDPGRTEDQDRSGAQAGRPHLPLDSLWGTGIYRRKGPRGQVPSPSASSRPWAQQAGTPDLGW